MKRDRMRGVVSWPAALAAQYRAEGVWRGQSLYDVLVECAGRFGDRTAVVDARRRLSYRELLLRSERLARGLLGQGITAGDAVLVQLPNSVTFLEVCFALFRLGARPVMAQPAHRQLELRQFAQKTRAVALVVSDTFARFDYRALAQQVQAACPQLRHVLVAGDPGAFTSLESLFAESSVALPPLPSAADVGLFQLSGGSTSTPKLIARSHDDYAYSIRTSNAVCGFDERTVYLAALPVAHNFTLSSPGVLGTLFAGGRVVMCEQPTPDLAFDWIEREAVTVTALVPALLPAWLAAATRRRDSVRTLALLQIGGAKLHEALASRVAPELGATLQQVFGMAEGLVCYTRPSDPIEQVIRCQGRPMSPLDELRIVDDADADVAPGEVGHLLTRGPYTIRGYYDDPEHDAQAFTRDRFYRTGDLVRRTSQGNLVVEGRSKDQINRGGEKIAAPEVEAQLLAQSGVEAAALVGLPDRHLGERSCAFVVARSDVTVVALCAQLRMAGLAAHKIPDQIVLLESLPKTAIGKVDKRSLRALAVARFLPKTDESAQRSSPLATEKNS